MVALLAIAPAALAGTPPAGFSDSQVASGFSQPTAIAFLPDGRLLLTEKAGALRLVDGATNPTLTTIDVCSGSEMGLLGIAIDPSFAQNGFIYLYRTKAGPSGCGSSSGRFNQVVRVTMSGNSVVGGSLTELLTGIRTDGGNHDGGGLRIGPDRKLYVSVGETGIGDSNGPPGSSTNPYAQDLGALEGKILRLELNGAPAAGNPFAGTPGARPEIFAYGFRNPYRFGIDPLTGRLWVGDVGEKTFEEIDVVSAGANYGWPQCEGNLPTGCERQPPSVLPVLAYPRSGAGALGATVIGGTFGPASFGVLAGSYFFADWVANAIYCAGPDATRTGFVAYPASFVQNADEPVDLITGPDGALYYISYSGEVHGIASLGGAGPAACKPATFAGTPGPPGAGAGGAGSAADRSITLKVSWKRVQRPLRRHAVVVTVGCPLEACTAIAGARVRVVGEAHRARTLRLRPVRGALSAGHAKKLGLKLRKRALEQLRRTLRRRGRSRATISVVATDAAGNNAKRRLSIRLVR